MSRILIIEDETEIADLERDYLELSGFEVETEHQGDVGLKRAFTEEFDLFILDLDVYKRQAYRRKNLCGWKGCLYAE